MADPAGIDSRSPRAWGVMAVLCAAQVLEVLGVTVVIVALPAIGAGLGLDTSSLQLVISVYAAVYGGLLVMAGRVADLLDRRVVLAMGLGVTLAGAVGCALAPSGGVLLAARALQGLGAAFVTPSALSLLTASFPAGRGRRVAVSAWTGAAAGGGAVGFALGGLIVGAVGWRGIFWLLVPLAVVVLIATRWLLPAHPPQLTRHGFDLPGALAATAGLILLVWGASLLGRPRPTPLLAAIVLAAGLGLLGVFMALQRHGHSPLIAWSALTNGAFITANGAAFVNTATTSASGALVALAARRVLRLSAQDTGLVLLPFSLMVVIGSASGSWWLRRPPHVGMATGLAAIAFALLGLAAATAAASTTGFTVAVGVAGLGLSWAAVTSTSAATHALPSEQQGIASGAVNTAAQLGTALGVAALLALAELLSTPGQRTGYIAAFVIAAAAAAGYAGLLLLRASTNPKTAHGSPKHAPRGPTAA